MMKSKYTVLSAAIAMILAGCGGAPMEKKAELAPVDTMGQAAAPDTKATESAQVVSVAAEPEPAKAVAPAVVEPKSAPAPVPAPVEAKVVAPVVQAAVKPAPAPAPKRKLNIPTDPNSFLVTAAVKTSEHPYFGRGKVLGFEVNGKQGRDVVVTRDEDYTFIVDTGVQHDFYLTTNPAGWGSGTYTNGVEGQFIYKGEVSFSPNKNTPDLLYYNCRNHKYMGGKIFVLDKGEDLAKLKASLASSIKITSSQRSRSTAVVSESSVKQKLGYAQMVIASGSAKRIEASGNAEAINMLNNARSQINAAKVSLAASQLEQAMTLVNDGLRLMTAASRQITSESEMAGVDHKAQYDELSNSLKTYEGSYKKNVERAAKIKQPVKASLNQAEYDALVKEGHALAAKGDHAAANQSLHKAQELITAVLTDMLHAQTVTYDKKFETVKEEYEYELARLENYEELVPLAIEQKQPSENALKLIDSFVQKAAKIKGEGQAIAAKGDYKMAIMAMQAGTSNLQRALRMAGVN